MQEGPYFYGLTRINIKQTQQKAAAGSFHPLWRLSFLPAAKRNRSPFLCISSQLLNSDYISQELISTYCRRRSDGGWHRRLRHQPERNRQGGRCRLEGAARPCSSSTFLCRTVQTVAEYMESPIKLSLYCLALPLQLQGVGTAQLRGPGTPLGLDEMMPAWNEELWPHNRTGSLCWSASMRTDRCLSALWGESNIRRDFYRQAWGLLHWFWGIIGDAG